MAESHLLDEPEILLASGAPDVQWWTDAARIHWKGFWLRPEFAKASMAIEKEFRPVATDVILASFPKSGMTWLKALTISILGEKFLHDNSDPLLLRNPHELVPFLEVETFGENPNLSQNYFHNLCPSLPRVFGTHLPCSILPDQIKSSGCRMIYICRHPADVFVSLWHYHEKRFGRTTTMEMALEEFSEGRVPCGPFFDHVLEYWNERQRSNNLLFLTYEELKRDPHMHVKRVADFLNCPLSRDEAERVVEKCSFERLSKIEVNKDDTGRVHWSGTKFGSFFRTGEVGDWKNHLTKEMAERLYKTARERWAGSRLELRLLADYPN